MSQITKSQAEAAVELARGEVTVNVRKSHFLHVKAVDWLSRGCFENAYWTAMGSLEHSVGKSGRAYRMAVSLL